MTSIIARIMEAFGTNPPRAAVEAGLTVQRVGRSWVVTGAGGSTFQGRERRRPDDLDLRIMAASAAAELVALPEDQAASRRRANGIEVPSYAVYQLAHHSTTR